MEQTCFSNFTCLPQFYSIFVAANFVFLPRCCGGCGEACECEQKCWVSRRESSCWCRCFTAVTLSATSPWQLSSFVFGGILLSHWKTRLRLSLPRSLCQFCLCWVVLSHSQFMSSVYELYFVVLPQSLPFPQIDVIRAMVIVWRARGKIITSFLCSIVCNSCTQWTAHMYIMNRPNSSLDWVFVSLGPFHCA